MTLTPDTEAYIITFMNTECTGDIFNTNTY